MLAALTSILLPLIPPLIRGVERAITRPKSGPDKQDGVRQALRQVIVAMIQAKVQLPDGSTPSQPTDDALNALIESEFQRMQVGGKIPEASEGKIYVLRGSIQEIKP